MKLKVVCQICGEKGTVDIGKLTLEEGWRCFFLNEVVEGLEDWENWEIWVCPCVGELKERQDWIELEEKIKKAMEMG